MLFLCSYSSSQLSCTFPAMNSIIIPYIYIYTHHRWLKGNITNFNHEARTRDSPVLMSLIVQSKRTPVLPDAQHQWSIWTTSPLQNHRHSIIYSNVKLICKLIMFCWQVFTLTKKDIDPPRYACHERPMPSPFYAFPVLYRNLFRLPDLVSWHGSAMFPIILYRQIIRYNQFDFIVQLV